ncbi:DNA cytosine methyltransferase [Nonomuraea sp. SYSU D8015]|uniref:DNA cytosine methyltransferase n=1 Tax=Nonomuraea sp. SYSU D8015 TaxID=2593644 RepID=UPI001660F3D6|nr:DNA cytosine methyltransferase [Nonomuraea sp. SYSU D8015]
MILNLYAGPGGVEQGARILDVEEPILGYDIDADACATARAAGFRRSQASVPQLDPDEFAGVRGVVITSPCPPFSVAGKGSGLREHDQAALRLAVERLGDAHAGCCPDDAYAEVYRQVQDDRSALVIEALRFALRLPHVQWVVAEQVPAVAPLWREMAAELAAVHDFRYCAVVTLAAEDFGVASRRMRTFLIATRYHTPDLAGMPMRSWWSCGRFAPPAEHLPNRADVFGPTSMADALGWPARQWVNTRGNRRSVGGNEFCADRPAWCLTEKARSWRRVGDGARLTSSQAGLLVGFPADFAWQGSRSKQFLQVADVVAPPVAAAVLGAVLGLDWRSAVGVYPERLYPGRRTAGYVQPELFDADFERVVA